MSSPTKFLLMRVGLALGVVLFGVGLYLGQGHDTATEGPPWAAAICMMSGGILMTLGLGAEAWRRIFGIGKPDSAVEPDRA